MAGTRRVTLREASEELGVSVEAVRNRVKRESLRADKDPDGRVYVYLDASPPTSSPEPEVEGSEMVGELREQVGYLREQLRREQDAHAEARRIIAGLVRRVPELEAPREAPEAPETVEEEPERAEPHPDTPGAQTTTQHQQVQRPTEGVEHDAGALREWTGDVEARPRPDAPGAQESAQRPWWRRMFGG